MRYERFRSDYKPLIRPDDMVTRTHEALQLGDAFCARIRLIRKQLKGIVAGWAEPVVLTLMEGGSMPESFGSEEMELLRDLYQAHEDSVLDAKFREGYFDTLEDIALFFMFFGLRPGRVLGAIKGAHLDSIRRIYDTHSTAHKKMALLTMIELLMLEMNQTQRVFVLFNADRGRLHDTIPAE